MDRQCVAQTQRQKDRDRTKTQSFTELTSFGVNESPCLCSFRPCFYLIAVVLLLLLLFLLCVFVFTFSIIAAAGATDAGTDYGYSDVNLQPCAYGYQELDFVPQSGNTYRIDSLATGRVLAVHDNIEAPGSLIGGKY